MPDWDPRADPTRTGDRRSPRSARLVMAALAATGAIALIAQFFS